MPTTTITAATSPTVTAFTATRQHFPKSITYTTAGVFAAYLLMAGTIPIAMAETQKQYYGAAPDATHPWAVHDADRPLPPIVTPGQPSTQAQVGTAPSDAVVLFDGSHADAFEHFDGRAAEWAIENGELVIKPGTGDIRTKQAFGDVQLHIEWYVPGVEANRHGQNRGNSGVFLMQQYEVQVLDTLHNKTYADGMAGSIYGQNPPLVNPGLGLDQWQTYDIIFRRPHFDEQGHLIQPATITVLQNGVLVQDHWTLEGPTRHKKRTSYEAHAQALPLKLQDHSEPTRYRNIWIRPLTPRPLSPLATKPAECCEQTPTGNEPANNG